MCRFPNCHKRGGARGGGGISIRPMNDTPILSILESRAPKRGWDFNEQLFAALVFLVVVLPALLSGLVILTMMWGGPK